MKKRYLILIILIVIVPIIINEAKNRPSYNLINDGKKLFKNVQKYVNDNSINYEEILINNSYKLGNNTYDIKGEGYIFIDKTITFMLSRDDKCIMKLDYSKDFMIQNEKCPKYRMFSGIKEPIKEEGSGLYENNNYFYYKGDNVNNYLFYNNETWYILGFTDKSIRLINCVYNKGNYEYTKLSEDEYNNTLVDGKSFLSSNMIDNDYPVIEIDRNNLHFNGDGSLSSPYVID